jgi:hypothetical protein
MTRSKSESREERSSEVEGSWKRHKINLDDLPAEYVFSTLTISSSSLRLSSFG